METFSNVFQYPYSVIDNKPFTMRGQWRNDYFHNDNPIVLELGCGKGEYTVELLNFIPIPTSLGWILRAHACGKGLKWLWKRG